MFTFLQEFASSWTGSTATRLVDACRAHLEQKRNQLAIAHVNEEQALRATAGAQSEVDTQNENVVDAENKLKSHVSAHTKRLQTLAQAVMAISNSATRDNIEAVRQVLDMAESCSAKTFADGVEDTDTVILAAVADLEKAKKNAAEAKSALRLASDRRTTLEKQIHEIESIQSQLKPPATPAD